MSSGMVFLFVNTHRMLRLILPRLIPPTRTLLRPPMTIQLHKPPCEMQRIPSILTMAVQTREYKKYRAAQRPKSPKAIGKGGKTARLKSALKVNILLSRIGFDGDVYRRSRNVFDAINPQDHG